MKKILIFLSMCFMGILLFNCKDDFDYNNTPQNPVVSIAVKRAPDKVSYRVGDKVLLDSMLITITFKNGETKDVSMDLFEKNRIRITPAHGEDLSLDVTTLDITHLTSNAKTSQPITVMPAPTGPIAMAWPATWGEGGIYLISNFVAANQADGGNANNQLVSGAWVWAGGDFKNMAITHQAEYSYLNLIYGGPTAGWAAWMFGGAMNLSGTIDQYKLEMEVRGKGRWLFQLVDANDVHHSAAIDLTEAEGWHTVQVPFSAFGSFDIATIGTFKIAAENNVTAANDYIDATNIRFVKGN